MCIRDSLSSSLLCTRNTLHRESEEEVFQLPGQLAQPNQDSVFSTRAAFFNGHENKVGHIMAKASALGVNLNLLPSVPCTPLKASIGEEVSGAPQLSHTRAHFQLP